MFKKIFLSVVLVIATISTPIYAQGSSSSSLSSTSSEASVASSSLNSSSTSSQSSSNSSSESQNSSQFSSSSSSSITNEDLLSQTKNKENEQKEAPKVDLKPTSTRKRQLLVQLKTPKTNKELANSLAQKNPNKPLPIQTNSNQPESSPSNLLLVEVKPDENLNDTAQKIKALPEVESVQTNNPYQFDSITPTNNPNYTSDQWYLKNSNTNPMGIYAQSAWQTVGTALGNSNSGGSSSVKIAIIDSGVNTTLADFAGVNVANSARFFSKASTCDPLAGEEFLAGPFGDSSSFYYICRQVGSQYDEVGHGTAVAGVIYMQDNSINGVGVAHKTTMMPIALHGDAFSTYGVAKAIRYAVDNGAKVINMSLGTPFDDIPVKTEINYAISQGVSLVASSGNCGNKTGAQCYPFLTTADPEYYVPANITSYPAAYPDVITVGAINPDGTKSNYSTAGSYVDLVAPVGQTGVSGGAVYSICGVVTESNPCFGKAIGAGSYWTGTSFSAPQVAGAIGLLRSAKTNLTSSQADFLIKHRSTDLGIFKRDDQFGYGVLKSSEIFNDNVNINAKFVSAFNYNGSYNTVVTSDSKDLYQFNYVSKWLAYTTNPTFPNKSAGQASFLREGPWINLFQTNPDTSEVTYRYSNDGEKWSDTLSVNNLSTNRQVLAVNHLGWYNLFSLDSSGNLYHQYFTKTPSRWSVPKKIATETNIQNMTALVDGDWINLFYNTPDGKVHYIYATNSLPWSQSVLVNNLTTSNKLYAVNHLGWYNLFSLDANGNLSHQYFTKSPSRWSVPTSVASETNLQDISIIVDGDWFNLFYVTSTGSVSYRYRSTNTPWSSPQTHSIYN